MGICHVKDPWNNFLDTHMSTLIFNHQLPIATAQKQKTRQESRKAMLGNPKTAQTPENKNGQPSHYPFGWFFLQQKRPKSIQWVFAMSKTPGIISWTHMPSTTSFHHQLLSLNPPQTPQTKEKQPNPQNAESIHLDSSFSNTSVLRIFTSYLPC